MKNHIMIIAFFVLILYVDNIMENTLEDVEHPKLKKIQK